MSLFFKKKFILPLIIISLMGINIPKVKAEPIPDLCQEKKALAYYELETSWIYICSESDQLFLFQASKKDPNNILKIPASGGFPTYAGIEGELADPNSKIYNISPFYFQIIEASIITKIERVLRTLEPSLNLMITPLSGEEKSKALSICKEDKPVQVFETQSSNIYICIEAEQNDPNAVNLTYVQVDKSNSNSEIRLPAELISSFNYQTSTENQTSYIISYKGLETYQNDSLVKTEPVTNLYLLPSEPNNKVHN